MANVTVTKHKYNVENLFQWDTKQTLEIYGLSLSQTPEVHFANDFMKKAIVRQASMDSAGVIQVEIPDYLLQFPYQVNAFVCTREGETLSTLYKIIIPVMARPMPSDYEGEDEAEVFSLEALGADVIMLDPEADAKVEKVLNADGTWTLRFSLPRGGKGDPGEAIITGKGIEDALGYVPADAKNVGALSAEKLDKKDVFGWAKAEQFDVSNMTGGAGTEVREGFYTYNDNATNFTYAMPNPQPGKVTIKVRFERTETNADAITDFRLVYSDGTSSNVRCAPREVHTITSQAEKTLISFTGQYMSDKQVFLDLSVMSMIADYGVPGGTEDPVTGATEETDGAAGLVPAPVAGDQDKVLHGDGTWKVVVGGNPTALTIIRNLLGKAAYTEDVTELLASLDEALENGGGSGGGDTGGGDSGDGGSTETTEKLEWWWLNTMNTTTFEYTKFDQSGGSAANVYVASVSIGPVFSDGNAVIHITLDKTKVSKYKFRLFIYDKEGNAYKASAAGTDYGNPTSGDLSEYPLRDPGSANRVFVDGDWSYKIPAGCSVVVQCEFADALQNSTIVDTSLLDANGKIYGVIDAITFRGEVLNAYVVREA